MSLYSFHGEDLFSARQEIAALRVRYLTGDLADLNCTVLDGTRLTFDELLASTEAFPFLSTHRLVVVENLLSRLTTGKQPASQTDGATGEPAPTGWAAQLQDYLPTVPEQTVLVFHDCKKLDAKSRLLKTVEKHGEVRCFGLKKGLELEDWIRKAAAALGVKVDGPAVKMLANYVGGDLYAMSSELQKLAAYAGPGATVGAEEVRLLVADVRESIIFNLTDALAARDRGAALATARGLVEDGRPVAWVLTKIAQHFRELIQVKEGASRGWSVTDVQREVGVKEFPAKKLLAQSRQLSAGDMQSAYAPLIEADLALKTGRVRPEVVLEQLVVTLCRR